MEPRIHGGSDRVFAALVEGSHQGKIVLVQHRHEVDPESGKRYTVKCYVSERSTGADGM